MTEEEYSAINRQDVEADILEALENGKDNVMKFKDELKASEIDKIVKISKSDLFYTVSNAYLMGYQRGAERAIELSHKGHEGYMKGVN
jgi:hypothetical protein